MEDIVQSLQRAYQALIASGLSIMEAKEAQAADSQARSVRIDTALELFHNNLQLFHAACDRAQEILESVRLRIGSECIVDEATGSVSAKLAKMAEEGTNKQGVAPLSAIRLEQLSRAVRGLVLDLQQGAASTTQSGPSQSGLNVNGPEGSSVEDSQS
eukprot:TRINITY_DN1442_c0_g1_i2.p1 TRINITY_DN1442_c0_g1~~TRINITY_DN1442_c0_g1_i2.p1  ORF type:complete len:157 (+),score=28.65 TRINITY_DN1442_c0_g1_i2:111-581(+)